MSEKPHAQPPIHDQARVLLFFGAERSGSTLLGQMLNVHPACLIATESRFVDHVLAGDWTVRDGLAHCARDAWRQFNVGLENDGRFADSIREGMQPRWQSFSSLASNSVFQKNNVSIVGDKKAGANAQALMTQPAEVRALLDALDARVLQIVRDPACAAASSSKAFGRDYETACEQIVSRSLAAAELVNSLGGHGRRVRYEQLCTHPQETLQDIAAWLGIAPTRAWVSACADRVSVGADDGTPSQRAIAARIIEQHEGAALWPEYSGAAA